MQFPRLPKRAEGAEGKTTVPLVPTPEYATHMRQDESITRLAPGFSRAMMPHCDSAVLHAPSICEYCDDYPDYQELRRLWGINFTGENDPDKLPCPSEVRRSLDVINRWGGNRPKPKKHQGEDE